MRHIRTTVCVFACICGLANAAPAKEKHQVTLSYVIGPAKSLPEGLNVVAVVDSGVQMRGVREDEREHKWSLLAADVIEAMLTSDDGNRPGELRVARRDLTEQILKEQDLRLAGLVEGGAASKAGRLLDVQGLITSEIHIDIDVDRSTRSTIDWGAVLGGAVGRRTSPFMTPPLKIGDPRVMPYMGPSPQEKVDRRDQPEKVDRRDQPTKQDRRDDPRRVVVVRRPPEQSRNVTFYRSRRVIVGRPIHGGYVVTPHPYHESAPLLVRDVQEINRHITVTASFQLVDAVTGQVLANFRPPPYHKEDSSAPDFFFGSLVKPEELDPVDMFIGELVERAAKDFVERIATSRVEYTYTIEGRDKYGESGIRALRGDDVNGAFEHFTRSLEHKERDQTLFALGVLSELRGEPRQALDFYRRALSKDPDKDDLRVYTDAKERLAAHLPRIIETCAGGQMRERAAPEAAPRERDVPEAEVPEERGGK